MSEDLLVFTEVLAAPDAKKLLAWLQKPAKGSGWRDWCGENGYQTEVKLAGLSRKQIGELHLPSFCSSMMIDLSEELNISDTKLPQSIFLGGDDWMPPEYGDCGTVKFKVFIKELNYPIFIAYSNRSDSRFFGRKYNDCREFEIMTSASFFEGMPPHWTLQRPSSSEFEEFMGKLWRRFNIPNEQSPQFLEKSDFGSGHTRNYFTPTDTDWFSLKFRAMIEELILESQEEIYFINARADLGVMTSVEGKMMNVTCEAQDLLRSIAERNSYELYDVTYYIVGPQNWQGREKSRKKWKQPIYQELGTAMLENGTTTIARLTIEKEGYVFTLDFEDVDALAAFRETKLFKKTQWNLGAE